MHPSAYSFATRALTPEQVAGKRVVEVGAYNYNGSARDAISVRDPKAYLGTDAQPGPGVDVVCPGFTSDCLETLEEIAMEGRQAFLSSGGKDFHYIPCLNDNAQWITALADIAQQHLAGWPTRTQPDAQCLRESQQRAMSMGAKN